MQNATNAVVTGKLEPVAKASPAAVALVTGQGLYDLHGKPFVDAARKESSKKAERIRKAAQEGVRCFAERGQTGLVEFHAALSAMVKILRDKADKTPEGSALRSDAGIIGVFASCVRTVTAAQVFERMGADALAAYKNSDTMLRDCRRSLEGDAERGLQHIDTLGAVVLHGEAKVAARIKRESAKAAAKAAEKAIMQGMNPEQAAHLMAEAQKAGAADAADEIREKIHAAASKFAKSLVAEKGRAQAIAYLRHALEIAEAIAA